LYLVTFPWTTYRVPHKQSTRLNLVVKGLISLVPIVILIGPIKRRYFNLKPIIAYVDRLKLVGFPSLSPFSPPSSLTFLADTFLIFLVGTNWTNGEIAREANVTQAVIISNAQQTQSVFANQSATTRQTVFLPPPYSPPSSSFPSSILFFACR
jgi:hypothetical protein